MDPQTAVFRGAKVAPTSRLVFLWGAITVTPWSFTSALQAQPERLDTMAGTLLEAAAAAKAADVVWPGFRFSDQVVLLVSTPDGPTLLFGDASPPPEYQAVPEFPGIYARPGTPPESLAVLRLAHDWNGRRGAATVIPYRDDAAFVLHEVFHSFQSQRHREDPSLLEGAAPPRVPLDDRDGVAWLLLEAQALRDAIAASTPAEGLQLAARAVAVRERRCAAADSIECSTQREVEQFEGAADYVAARTMAATGRRETDGIRFLDQPADALLLRRFHFYGTGHAWLLLLDRLGVPNWQVRTERTPPDRVVAEFIGPERTAADTQIMPAWLSSRFNEAQRQADQVLAAEVQRIAAEAEQLAEVAGTPVKIYLLPDAQTSLSGRSLGGGRREISILLTETDSAVRLRARVRSLGAGFEVTVPIEGAVAHVGELAVPLEKPRPTMRGRIEIEVPGLSVRLQDGDLAIHADSIVVRQRR